MNKYILLAAMTGGVVFAADTTEPVKPKIGGTTTPIEHKKDPLQSNNNPTTGIVSNNAAVGSAAAAQTGTVNVDKDLQKRVTVALSSGSIGTQGVLAQDQLTDIKVTVTNRQVTLRGEVISEKNKETLGKRVAGLDGVKGVNNLLTINPKAKPARADLVQPDGYSPGSKNSNIAK